MNNQEKERYRIEASIQELMGATDEEVAADSAVETAIRSIARIIHKFRADKREREETRIRIQILKQVGIPVIEPKKK